MTTVWKVEILGHELLLDEDELERKKRCDECHEIRNDDRIHAIAVDGIVDRELCTECKDELLGNDNTLAELFG